MCRIPDSFLTTHTLSLVGPLALTRFRLLFDAIACVVRPFTFAYSLFALCVQSPSVMYIYTEQHASSIAGVPAHSHSHVLPSYTVQCHSKLDDQGKYSEASTMDGGT
jgi:hypothetical protein